MKPAEAGRAIILKIGRNRSLSTTLLDKELVQHRKCSQTSLTSRPGETCLYTEVQCFHSSSTAGARGGGPHHRVEEPKGNVALFGRVGAGPLRLRGHCAYFAS